MTKKLSSLLETAIVIGGLIAAPIFVLASFESVAAAVQTDRATSPWSRIFPLPGLQTRRTEILGSKRIKEIVMTRSKYLPWYIGLAIIVIGDAIALLLTDEGAAELAQQTTLVAVPIVALALMFLMFRSEK